MNSTKEKDQEGRDYWTVEECMSYPEERCSHVVGGAAGTGECGNASRGEACSRNLCRRWHRCFGEWEKYPRRQLCVADSCSG
jgi:hypothetical protein